MKAMIFAAGMGTRLKPLTDTVPKALVPVAGKPLLEHVARKLMDSGVDEVVVNVHHFADMVEDWIGSQDWICTGTSGRTEGMLPVRISDERQRLLETGGAVLHARSHLEGCGRFIVYNVDILSDIDISWFVSRAHPDALAALLVSARPSGRSLLFEPETMRLVGWMNNLTGEVRSPRPIDAGSCLKLAFSGIHILSDRIFDAMERYAEAHGLLSGSDDPKFPIIDFYIWASAFHDIFGVRSDDMKLIDVGKLDSLEKAEMFILRHDIP